MPEIFGLMSSLYVNQFNIFLSTFIKYILFVPLTGYLRPANSYTGKRYAEFVREILDNGLLQLLLLDLRSKSAFSVYYLQLQRYELTPYFLMING